jgi:hypothetical protein
MCGGGDSGPTLRAIPDAPSIEEMYDALDLISGVQQKTVKDPLTGKRRVIRERIERSPEEEEIFNNAGEMIRSSVVKIMQAAREDPNAFVAFQPVIDAISSMSEQRQRDLAHLNAFADINEQVRAYKTLKQDFLERDLRIQENKIESELVRKGLSNSSAGREERALFELNKERLRQETDVMGDIYGENLATNRYGIAERQFAQQEAARGTSLRDELLKIEGRRGEIEQLEKNKDRLLREDYRNLEIGSNLRGADLAKAVGARAPEFAFNQWNAEEGHKTSRYQAQVAAINAENQNAIMQHSMEPPSMASTLFNLGAKGVGAYATGGLSGKGAILENRQGLFGK